jgi:hypothetical protein
MFTTRKSRERLVVGLQIAPAAALIVFAVAATYFTTWINGSLAGILIGIVTTIIWAALWVVYFVSLPFNLEEEHYTGFTITAIIGMLVGPLLTLFGFWRPVASYPAVMTDIFLVVGWIFTVVMCCILIFATPEYITDWMGAGKDEKEVKREQEAARTAKEAAQAAERAKKEPDDIPVRDQKPLPEGHDFEQPPHRSAH